MYEYTLGLGENFTVGVWTYGAMLVDVLVPDRSGELANVTLRLPDLASYTDRARNPYLGCVMGRFCRCVRDGQFTLDGVVHRLDRNDGRHHLHGGSMGFDQFGWQADAYRDGDTAAVRLWLDRPDGDQGYPGAMSAQVIYRVEPGGRLSIDYRATTTASTIVGLTNHAFWNLAGHGSVRGHHLMINAGRSVLLDSELMPLPGGPESIAGTSLDYRTTRPLNGQRIDNFFVLDGGAPDVLDGWVPDVLDGYASDVLGGGVPDVLDGYALDAGQLRLAAVVRDPASGRTLRVSTDQSGLGVYSGDHLTPTQAGICLQTSAWPDAPNRADFPSCRLDPGETYRHRAVFDFIAE